MSIPTCIASHVIQTEANVPTDWSSDGLLHALHLIEIDTVDFNSVCAHVTMNGINCRVKQDTGAQINVID